MYSAENYFWGWVVYTTGALCLLSCAWYLLRRLTNAALRQSIMLVATAFLMTPVTAHRDDFHLAPAFFVSLYEGLVSGIGYQRGVAPIMAMTVLALTLFAIIKFISNRIRNSLPVRVRPAYSSDKRRRSNL